MDPSEADSLRKVMWCAVCKLTAKLNKPIGFVDEQPVYINHGWRCTKCNSTSNPTPPSDYEFPFHETESMSSSSLCVPKEDEVIAPKSPFPNGLKFIHQNVNGLRTKFDEYRNLLISDAKICVLALTETKLKSCRDLMTPYEIDNYAMLRFDREGDKEGGGTIVYINKYFEFENLPLSFTVPMYVECTIVKLKCTGIKSIIVVIIYVPPDLVNDDFFSLLNSLHLFLCKFNSEKIIFGDFNVDLQNSSNYCKRLKVISKEFHFTQMVKFPTRVACNRNKVKGYSISSSLLDHVYINSLKWYNQVGGFDFGGSDHKLVYVIRKKEKSVNVTRKTISYRSYKSIDTEKFSKELSLINWSILKYVDVNESFERFNSVIMTYLNAHAPLKTKSVKSDSAPWYNNELQEICKKRDQTKTLFNKIRDFNVFNEYKRLRNSATTTLLKAKNTFIRQRFEKCKSSVDVWNTMNTLINFRAKKSSKISTLIDNQGNSLIDDNDIANKLANEFVVKNSEGDISVYANEVKKYETDFVGNNPDYKYLKVISEEVIEAIRYVKKGGSDVSTVPRKVFKMFSLSLAVPLIFLFNTIFSLSVIPSKFKEAICTPLYKGKGPYCDSSSYRAIYGLSFVTKVFERIVYNRLLQMVKNNLSEFQHGFRRNRSCETATAFLTQSLFNSIDKRSGKAIAVFIDFRKAFDSIDHGVLMHKLISKFDGKIEPYMLKILLDYFQNRSFKIKNGNNISQSFSIKSGTPAGSALGPLIFSLFINDIGDCLTLPYALYADDLVFFVDATNLGEGIKKINECYMSLVLWCEQNKLTINTSKTKVMYFHKPNDFKSKNLLGSVIRLNDEDIDVVQSFKYLGVYLDSTLSFQSHYDNVKLKISVALGKMYSLRRFFTQNVVKAFLSCYVISIADYCLSIWCVQTDKMIQVIQDKIDNYIYSYFFPRLSSRCRRRKVLSDKNCMPILLEKLNILTICERRKVTLLKFVTKELKHGLYDNWFVRSRGADDDSNIVRLQVPSFTSERYKHSVKYNCINIWNIFVQLVKPPPKAGMNEFVELCKCIMVSKRENV